MSLVYHCTDYFKEFAILDLRKKRETTRETLKNYSKLTSEQMEQNRLKLASL